MSCLVLSLAFLISCNDNTNDLSAEEKAKIDVIRQKYISAGDLVLSEPENVSKSTNTDEAEAVYEFVNDESADKYVKEIEDIIGEELIAEESSVEANGIPAEEKVSKAAANQQLYGNIHSNWKTFLGNVYQAKYYAQSYTTGQTPTKLRVLMTRSGTVIYDCYVNNFSSVETPTRKYENRYWHEGFHEAFYSNGNYLSCSTRVR